LEIVRKRSRQIADLTNEVDRRVAKLDVPDVFEPERDQAYGHRSQAQVAAEFTPRHVGLDRQ
jgi:hypothetical protein